MSEPDPLLGRTLDGKYRVEEVIGRGGMGAVYRAVHVGTGRTVAVKVILPALVRDPEALERFRREARAAGGLRHPSIVDVTDFGTGRVGEAEVAYLVMEHLRGKTVREALKEQGRLPLGVVVDIVEQVALALHEAHERGIVHRDLKPDNVWLVPDPRGGYAVRVLDFGLAKLREPAAVREVREVREGDRPAPPGPGPSRPVPDPFSDESVTLLPTAAAAPGPGPLGASDDTETIAPGGVESRDTAMLTTAGTTLGTPGYMSPEQCRGGEVDFRSDLYSLGIMAWEAIAGRRPFTGSLAEVLRGHLEEIPARLDEAVPGTPSAVADVVARALSKDPAGRPPSARALAGSLRVGAESAGIIVRRSIALAVERFGPFQALSFRLSWPGLLVLVPVVAAAAVTPFPFAPMVLSIGCMASWGLVVASSHAGFALAIDRLRVRPLEDLRPDDILDEMRRRLSLPADAGRGRLLAALLAFYLRCEFEAKEAGTGDLAFLVLFLEGARLPEARERIQRLAAVARRSYNWVRGLIFAWLILFPVLEGAVFFAIASTFLPKGMAMIAAAIAALLLVPFNAVVVNPVFSSALAMLFFRARQANGEDVALSAILPTRL